MYKEDTTNHNYEANPQNKTTEQTHAKSITKKKIFIVMLFEFEHFVYDLMTFLSDFVKLYMNTYRGGNKDKTAADLTIARNTLTRLLDGEKPLRWDSCKEILTNLLRSDCPYPENEHIMVYNEDDFTNSYYVNCANCKYYKFYKCCSKGVDNIEKSK